jgi:hypothetical protein
VVQAQPVLEVEILQATTALNLHKLTEAVVVVAVLNMFQINLLKEDQVLLFLNIREELGLPEEQLHRQAVTPTTLLIAQGRLHQHESFCES